MNITTRFLSWMRLVVSGQEGQALTEYALVIAVVAVIAVAMFTALGDLSELFPSVSEVLTSDEVPHDDTGYGPRIAD